MRSLLLLISLFTIACSETPESLTESISLIKESVSAVNNSSKIIYYQIKQNAYEYEEKGKPWLNKADKIDSLITNYYAYLDEADSFGTSISKSEYLNGYAKVIEDINITLKADSFNPPEWFVFPSVDSVVSLDSIDSRMIPSVIKLNLAVLKADVFQLLQLMAPSSIACEGAKTIIVINEEIAGRDAEFDLTSRVFGLEEDRYIEIDSVLRNGIKVDDDVEMMQQFTFYRLTLDSLRSGRYKVFGTCIAFRNGNQMKESFSHEFAVK